MSCSQHTPAKELAKTSLGPARRPCAPWRLVLARPPAARALSPIAWLIAVAGRDKGSARRDIGLIFPRRRRERYEASRRGPHPPRPFSFPLPACKSHHSLSPEPSGAATSETERVRGKHLVKNRGGKERGKSPREKKKKRGRKSTKKERVKKTYQERARGGKTCREKARVKDLAKTRGRKRSKEKDLSRKGEG